MEICTLIMKEKHQGFNRMEESGQNCHGKYLAFSAPGFDEE
jgi:hypothetical protein